MNFEINSHVGAGLIRFGMSQQEVRRLVRDDNLESFKRTPTSILPCDHFPGFGVFIYYKTFDHVEALEFYPPANPIYSEIQILTAPALKVYNLISGLDKNVEFDGDGLISLSLGIGVYAPNYEDDHLAPVESVIVFEKGYYD